MPRDWESEIAKLLTKLSQTQDELLSLLAEKRDLLSDSDVDALAQMQPREEALQQQLQSCHDRRNQLLAAAADEGLPCDSVRSLASALPKPSRDQIQRDVGEASNRGRLLQHHGLTNWVLAQRTLLHLSQMLEIIATGGRPKPTYSKGESAPTTGSLVDRAA